MIKTLGLFLLSFILSMNTSYAENRKSEYRSPEHVEGAITTSVSEAKKLFDEGVVFIDVRNPRFYAKGHIPGALHMDFKYNFDEAKLDSVAGKDQPIIIYCSGVKCSRSYRASAKAVSWGFTKVHYLRAGFAEWKKAGYEYSTSVIKKD